MDKNTLIGFLLIFGLLIGMQLLTAPERKKMEEQQRVKLDSLRQLEKQRADSISTAVTSPVANTPPLDSTARAAQTSLLAGQFGAFAPAAVGEDKTEVLENDMMRILFSTKGGRIKAVELKQHFKVQRDSNHKESKLPLKLMEDGKNRFEYLLPVANVPAGTVSTEQLFFQATKSGETSISFKADAGGGAYFEQVYTIKPGSYGIQYSLNFNGLDNVLKRDGTVKLHWVDYLDKLEQNHNYERNYSTIYYKPADESYDYCDCTSEDEVDKSGKAMAWVANSNQFFASVLMAKDKPFKGANFKIETLEEDDKDLKKLESEIEIPFAESKTFAMELYTGPKDFETLRSYNQEIEDTIPFGRSILGSANRWVIRPLFNFLLSLIGVKGIAILALTLLVKLLLYPLSYKMLHSQAKMTALKPQLTSLREKFKDDQTQIQMESMKLYREFGVNPLGGCMPILLQMPVWLALYRFFPASIEFRQASFLWASDLSSYDAAFWIGNQHVSLFTVLWVITTLIYTHYNMQQMDMASMGGAGGAANAQMMKWMQYLMPVFFLFFFNNFASGLTCYLVFSNILNVAQTLVTKNWIINHDKIKEEMEAYRKQPKKKGGLQSRMEEALKQQQAITAQREAAAKKKK